MGHQVVLAEAGPQRGGQALLAQLLPERAEFGGLVTNLVTELGRAQVVIRLNTRVDRALIEAERPDAVIHRGKAGKFFYAGNEFLGCRHDGGRSRNPGQGRGR